MALITAALVGKLRAKTNAPIMACKKALNESGGDLDKAEKILRVKLGSKISKAASRVAAEGVIVSYISGGIGAIVEVNCETDFITRNNQFLALANACAKLVTDHNPPNVATLLTLPLNGSTVEAICGDLIGLVGENILIRRFRRFYTSAKLVSYLHGTRIGVIVEFEGNNEQVGKDVAMHIAAMGPISLSADQVPLDLIQKERSVAILRAAESRKSEKIVTKMIESAVQKFLKEVSLLSQNFVKNDKQTIEQMLKANNTSIKSFTRFIVGEGAEKKQETFTTAVEANISAAKKV